MTPVMSANVRTVEPGGVPSHAVRVEVEQGAATWLTPGAHVAQAVAKHADVRLVLERLEQDRLAVFVVLDDDSEELLDDIFEAERELYTSFQGLPFDIRVMTPSDDWSAADLCRDKISHYERPGSDGCRG